MIDLETLIILIVTATIMLIILTYLEFRKKPKKPEYITKELLECIKCNYRLEQDFEPGDFISMYKRKCPRCGGLMKIKAIYAVEKSFKHHI